MSLVTALPQQQRALAFVVSFRDAFFPESTGVVVRVPLVVEALGGRAWPGDDGTWRISVTGSPPVIPTGTFPVVVTAPGGEYVAVDPISVTLPLVVSVPPARADFLSVHALWPTRRLRIPSGETAVHGVVTSLGAPAPGLRVLLHPGAVPPPGTPEARTDAHGEFVYRFPFTPGASTGASLALTVTVFDGLSPATITPASLTLEAGRVHTRAFQRL